MTYSSMSDTQTHYSGIWNYFNAVAIRMLSYNYMMRFIVSKCLFANERKELQLKKKISPQLH